MILKVLLVVAVIGIVYFMFIKKKPIQNASKKDEKKASQKTNDMIECPTCNVYSDISECIISNGKYYCSPECVDKAK